MINLFYGSMLGGTHMLRHTGMCHPNEVLFHQKTLGPILVNKKKKKKKKIKLKKKKSP